LQFEKDEHMEILKKICGHKDIDTYKNNYEGSNGDPTVDPLTVIEKKLSKKHRALIGIKDEEDDQEEKKKDKYKLSNDGITVDG